MNINGTQLCHIYNQGNNRETIFYKPADYYKFMALYQRKVYPHCKTISYCLMPNHFHFLVYITAGSVVPMRSGNINTTALANGFRLLQSNYAQYINRVTGRTGSLFRQKTKCKSLDAGNGNYYNTAFWYIHQNPVAARLVSSMEDWPYSSYHEYLQATAEGICDTRLGAQLIGTAVCHDNKPPLISLTDEVRAHIL